MTPNAIFKKEWDTKMCQSHLKEKVHPRFSKSGEKHMTSTVVFLLIHYCRYLRENKILDSQCCLLGHCRAESWGGEGLLYVPVEIIWRRIWSLQKSEQLKRFEFVLIYRSPSDCKYPGCQAGVTAVEATTWIQHSWPKPWSMLLRIFSPLSSRL